MATKIMLDYCGMPGEGRTVKEAKQDAARKITAAMTAYYAPECFTWRGFSILVWRDTVRWHSSVLCDESGMRSGRLGGTCHPETEDREDVIRSVLGHLAQFGWKPEDGIDAPAILDGDKQLIAEHQSWARFQLRYREGRERGLSDNDAHSYALCNPARPELWQNVLSAVA